MRQKEESPGLQGSWYQRSVGVDLGHSGFMLLLNLDVRTGHLTKVGRHSQHTVGLLLCRKNWLIWLLGEKCNSNRMNILGKKNTQCTSFP